MSYEYLDSLEKFGINLGLERITYLLEQLGNPHLKFKSIHVAGTNGKGSTCAMMASILKEAGYKVGLYTSPHLFDYTERIQINGKQISKKQFEKGLKLVKGFVISPLPLGEGGSVQRKRGEGFNRHPTVFEVLTAVAFWYFAKRKVDYAVVEVGLGGRLDATNVITPLVSVITNIDYEHTEVLGKTLAKIATEKAAIVKPGVPVVTAETKPEALRVIKKFAEKRSSLLIQVSGKLLAPRLCSGQVVSCKLTGKHQRTNAACAVAAIQLAGVKVSRKAIRNGLRKVNWPGRFQVIQRKPLTIVDGAHNPAGTKVLAAALKAQFPGRKFQFVFGTQKDKDSKAMLGKIKPLAGKIIFTRSSHPWAARVIAGKKTVELKEALEKTEGRDRVVTGSLFLVADALGCLDAVSRP